MLTENQAKILNIIKKYKEENKISPSVRELTKLAGLKSTSTTHSYLTRLEKKGYIKRNPTCARTITILKETNPTVNVPVEELKKIKNLLESLGIENFGILGDIKFD